MDSMSASSSLNTKINRKRSQIKWNKMATNNVVNDGGHNLWRSLSISNGWKTAHVHDSSFILLYRCTVCFNFDRRVR